MNLTFILLTLILSTSQLAFGSEFELVLDHEVIQSLISSTEIDKEETVALKALESLGKSSFKATFNNDGKQFFASVDEFEATFSVRSKENGQKILMMDELVVADGSSDSIDFQAMANTLHQNNQPWFQFSLIKSAYAEPVTGGITLGIIYLVSLFVCHANAPSYSNGFFGHEGMYGRSENAEDLLSLGVCTIPVLNTMGAAFSVYAIAKNQDGESDKSYYRRDSEDFGRSGTGCVIEKKWGPFHKCKK